MSGPIVRSAPNKKFSQNWDSVFGAKKGTAQKKSPAKAVSSAKSAKTAKKKAGKKKS